MIISIFLYVILFFTAPLIAKFYQQPILINLIRVFTIVFVINAFSFVQETRLLKEMRFKLITLIHIPATVLGAVVSITMAMLGYGVWSIVAMHLVTSLAFTIQIWIYSNWRPTFTFKMKGVRELFYFGSKILISNIINTLYRNAYLIILGKYFPLSSVGYYKNSYNFTITPSMTFAILLNRVGFSAFSSIQESNKRLKKGYKQWIQISFFLICPIFVLAGVLANPIFSFVLGDKWLPAVPYFRWLCVVAIFYPLISHNLTIVNVKGRSDIYLTLHVVSKIVAVIGIILVIPLGIMPLLMVQAAVAIFTFLLVSYYAGSFINYSLYEQVKDILPVIVLSTVIGAIVFLLNKAISNWPNFTQIVLGFLIGSGVFVIFSKYFKLAPYCKLITIISEKLTRYRSNK